MARHYFKSVALIGMMIAACILSLSAAAQNRLVRGTVVDQQGQPVIGAAVMMVGNSTVGTVTDIDGAFSLNVPDNASLNVSFMGYVDQTVAVNGKDNIKVVLEEDTQFLEEIVVIGYGTVKKSDITGSVASVDTKEMMRRQPTNIGQALQGAAAGVIVTQQDGAPDANSAVRVRGVATINGTADPLYVVDGVQVGTNANFLNPADIESIEVLKDASATAIYGSAGANGVIMITTKHGSGGEGNLTITATADIGIQTLPYTLKTLDVDTYASSIRQARANDGNGLYNVVWDSKFDGKRHGIDWQKEMTQVAIKQQYGVSAAGGSSKAQYTFSVGYLNNDGIVVNTNYKRLTARANVKAKVNNYLEFGGDVNFVHAETSGSNVGFNNNGNLSSLRDFAYMAPTLDYLTNNDINGTLVNVNLVNPNGTYGAGYLNTSDGWEGNTKNASNPYATQMEANGVTKTNKVFASAYAQINFLNRGGHTLNLRSIGSYIYSASANNNFSGGRERYNIINGNYVESKLQDNGIDNRYSFSLGENEGNTLQLETYLTYDFQNKVHHVNLMLGNTISMYDGLWTSASASDFISADNRLTSLSTDNSTKVGSGGFNAQTRGLSYFARAMYSVYDRYIITATVRRDGSSNFGSGNRWGTFPSFAGAWNIAKEPWMQGARDVLNNFKFRVGWGQTGNAGNMTGKSTAALSSNACNYNVYPQGGTMGAFGGNMTRLTGLYPLLVDTNLKWETNQTLNFGLDFGFFDNSFTFSVDYYVRDAKDLLLNKQVRPSLGFSSVYTNYGSIRNKGFEFTIGYKKQFTRDFGMNVSLNGTTIKNEVVEMGDPVYATNDGSTGDGSNVGAVGAPAGFHWGNHSITKEGEAVGSFYGWKVDHIYTSQAEIDADNAAAKAKGFDYYQHQNTKVGDYRYVDVDSDGHVADDNSDMDILGNGFAKLTYGLNLGFNYKNWDFSLYAYGALGQKILSYSAMRLSNMFSSDDQTTPNILKSVYESVWSTSNPNGTVARLSLLDENYNMRVSDAYVKKGDYLRISNLQVGYTFNQPWMKAKLKMTSARFYVAVQNLATISPYCQYGDPEVGQGSVLYTGLDTGRYPMPRTYMFGVNLTF